MGLTIGLGPASVGGSGGGGGNQQGQTIFDLDFVDVVSYAKVTDKTITEFPKVDTSILCGFDSMFLDCTKLESVPLLDTLHLTSLYRTFSGCTSLKTIPLLDTSKVKTMQESFYGCSKLESVPLLDTSSVEIMSKTFQNCTSLKTVPAFDMSNVTNSTFMFVGCSSLETIPPLNTSKSTSFANMFNGCSALREISSLDALSVVTINAATFNNCVSLETCNIKNLKTSLPMSNCSALSKESVLYIFENAQTVTSACTITLHANVFAQFTDDEIAIATEKGFSVVG